MRLELKKVAAFIRSADDETLLDRATVYRGDMEPAAIDLIEGELSRRGLNESDIRRHEEHRRETILAGPVRRCQFCERPAVTRSMGWHRLWRRIPVFPRFFRRCESHAA